MAKIPEQSNYQNTQDFGNVDINKIYDIFISEIDSIRSFVNIEGSIGLLNNIPEDKVSSLMKNVKIESTVQESRCHAFYRLVGFPVVDKDNKFYNPGYDSPKFNKKIFLDDKRIIANNVDDDFRKLSFFRETYQKNISNTFSRPSFSTGVMSLLSVNNRDFISSIRSDDPFEYSYNDYKINLNNIVGNNVVSLGNFLDVNGNGINDSAISILKSQTHIITPFMVDPRIDFTVQPGCKVSVPFVENTAQLQVGENQIAKIPFIERVISERIINIKETDTDDKTISDTIDSFSFIKDDKLIKKVSSNSLTKLEKEQFLEFTNIMLSMMIKLVDSRKAIISIQSKYYFIPEISKNGPIDGCSVRDPFLTKYVYEKNPLLITDADKSLIVASLHSEVQRLSKEFNDEPDIMGTSIPKFGTIFSHANIEGIDSNIQDSLNSLLSKRKSIMSKASDSLKSIEIITGEFSGFGLCDIIAIVGSLYMIPIESLLGFLDEDAFNRMNKRFETNFERTKTITESMTDLHISVKDFYNLMDKIYIDVIKNNIT